MLSSPYSLPVVFLFYLSPVIHLATAMVLQLRPTSECPDYYRLLCCQNAIPQLASDTFWGYMFLLSALSVGRFPMVLIADCMPPCARTGRDPGAEGCLPTGERELCCPLDSLADCKEYDKDGSNQGRLRG
ncbi:hypothetical protein ACO22_03779 [Paracoccidioides brasiliensis]|uniref:Uncharacterized protein n=1 Tax=Paracoccidioides brasiliensis TaxID=121759 RepID=A0A1D2JEW8_PARBR|nr:hypothetical protein ACO22_03779 [Paracoccidioides brasiliensis]